MGMYAGHNEDWFAEEPTVAEDERETTAREDMACALAEQIRTAIPAAAVLVVARGSGGSTGVVATGAECGHDLDRFVLAQILDSANDDFATSARCRLVLGDHDLVEHTVARDRSGAVVGVIAARYRGRIASAWMGTVLARAAGSLAAWLAIEPGWESTSLLDEIEEPALAHDAGIILAANAPLARMLHCTTAGLIGTRVLEILPRLRLIRSCSLVLGGITRAAMIFERPPSRPCSSLLAAFERVLATRYAHLRRTAHLTIEDRDHAAVVAPPAALEELASLALLDVSSTFSNASARNHVRCRVFREGTSVVLELIATGPMSGGPGSEHLGSVLCTTRARALGGDFVSEASRSERRVLRASLPVAP